MVFVEVGSPYILAGAKTVFSCRSVWQIFMSMKCYHSLHASGRPTVNFWNLNWNIFLHWIVHFKEKRMIVIGIGYKKY